MLHNPNQPYMMYPMMDQGFQWQQYANNGQQQTTSSVDSARASKSTHSKSSSTDKDPKKNINKATKVNMMQAPAMNQFVPVYMLPPGFTGHPGAFNAALAAHQASQQHNMNNVHQQHHANNQQQAGIYQIPTYGHNVNGMYQSPYGANFSPYGAYGQPATTTQKGYYPAQNHYSGSDYNSASGHDTASSRNSKSSDSSAKRTSGSLTSKDSATHSSDGKQGKKKTSTIKKPTNNKNNNVKKFQSTHQITIQKGPKKPVKVQQSCGRSHSTGSDLSAGCSASHCPPANVVRVCSHDSDNSNSLASITEKRKISGCCSTECDHFGPIFETMRKFSNNQDFKKPDSDLTKKLIELTEFYLSDDYLAKDKYLLRQIRCKSEGYISIKLMTSFKKVKKLTRDWRTVRFALLQSPNLIVSPEGFRVKRSTQLPENLRKPRLLSSVVTIRLTEELSSVDSITNMFAKYGEIGLVRILKPGKEIPSDLRNYATQVPDIGKTMCAVVDFEQSESALQAVRCLKDNLVEQKMRLALLGPRVRRTLYKQDNKEDGDDEEDDEEIEKQIKDNINNIEPETQDNNNNIITKSKLTGNSSNESNTNSSHSLDLSIDSGNCNASSTGHQSSDEDLHKVVLKDDINSQNKNTKSILIINNKISTIYREPEGPGANPEVNGFAIKRSEKCF